MAALTPVCSIMRPKSSYFPTFPLPGGGGMCEQYALVSLCGIDLPATTTEGGSD